MKKPSMKKGGKPCKEERLPSRFARSELTGGDMVQRSMNNYAKKAPKAQDAPSFMFMSKMF